MSMCACLGPQRGEPFCPCRMRAMREWQDQHKPYPQNTLVSQGCVCPPGAEATCRGPLCPRQPIGPATALRAAPASPESLGVPQDEVQHLTAEKENGDG